MQEPEHTKQRKTAEELEAMIHADLSQAAAVHDVAL
jgi:hypothetical protein